MKYALLHLACILRAPWKISNAIWHLEGIAREIPRLF